MSKFSGTTHRGTGGFRITRNGLSVIPIGGVCVGLIRLSRILARVSFPRLGFPRACSVVTGNTRSMSGVADFEASTAALSRCKQGSLWRGLPSRLPSGVAEVHYHPRLGFPLSGRCLLAFFGHGLFGLESSERIRKAVIGDSKSDVRLSSFLDPFRSSCALRRHACWYGDPGGIGALVLDSSAAGISVAFTEASVPS